MTPLGPLRVKKVAKKSENAKKSVLNAAGRGAHLVRVNKQVIARLLIYYSFGDSWGLARKLWFFDRDRSKKGLFSTREGNCVHFTQKR